MVRTVSTSRKCCFEFVTILISSVILAWSSVNTSTRRLLKSVFGYNDWVELNWIELNWIELCNVWAKNQKLYHDVFTFDSVVSGKIILQKHGQWIKFDGVTSGEIAPKTIDQLLGASPRLDLNDFISKTKTWPGRFFEILSVWYSLIILV